MKKKSKNNKFLALEPNFRKELKKILPEDMEQALSILYEIATKDEKTNLYNNHFFNNILEIEIEKTKREKKPLSLIMLDIDFFKNINEIYGHIEADEILYHLARFLEKQCRKSDIIARFGGDEFLILLPKTNSNQAKKLVSRFKNALKKDPQLAKYKLCLSGGVTLFRKRDNKKTFLKRANKGLQKSKKQGKNQFSIE